jgi:hypothetical protein
MSVSVGKSSIVTKNLVLYLDAASSSNYTLSEVEVLVVAGGGAGGGRHAGGGGGGGVIYVTSHAVTQGSAITVTVGNGGATGGYGSRGGNGQNSVFGALTAIGGGGGGGYADGAATVIGASGGSGGGGAGAAGLAGGNGSGGAGTSGQGNRGGDPWTSGWPGGGGGGAGAPGQSPRNGLYGGRGGDGLLYNISGTPRYYAGGGGGAGEGNVDLNGALGGLGGGGRSTGAYNPTQGQPGQANTGGGGGGSRDQAGALGGSGVVIVRYPGPQKATGGTITQVGGYTIHTFTSSGTFTPLTTPANAGAVYGLQDLSGNNNTGTQSGGVTYSTANGGSIVFDGSNDYVTLSSSQLAPGTGAFTWNFWIKLSDLSNASIIFSGTGSNTNYGVVFANPSVYGLGYYANGFRIIDGNTSFGSNWWYITFVGNGGANGSRNLKLYRNTIQAGSTYTFDYNFTSTTPIIGANHSSFAELMRGNISNVSYYNRALTAAEIQQNYNALRGRFGI